MQRDSSGVKAHWVQFGMADKILFIEGSDQSRYLNDWRKGFETLLRNAGLLKLPRIIACYGRDKAIDEYKKELGRNEKEVLLLVDLDAPENQKQTVLSEKGLTKHTKTVFFSIQEIEAWILSQPEVLDVFFGKGKNGELASRKLTLKHPSLFADPKLELKRITKGTKRGAYLDSVHGPVLLQKLDAKILTNAFPSEFGRLVDYLSK